MFASDRNDCAPRLGLVWALGSDQRTVVRTGAAVSYLMPQAIHYYDMAFVHPDLPFVATFAAADVPSQYLAYPLTVEFTNRVAADPSLLPKSFRLSRSIADYNRRDTDVNMGNLAIQRAVTPGFAIQAAYVGERTVKLISVRPLNLVDPLTRSRPVPELGQINFEENAPNISYHAMQLSFNQRPWRGLRYDAYFTWAKSIGYYNPDETITFTLREQHRLTFRLEVFNVLNHAPFSNPVTSFSDPNFGKIQSAGTPRNIQVALKYTF